MMTMVYSNQQQREKMKTKTFRFYWWDIDTKTWNQPYAERTTKTVDKTWTMPSDTDLELYARYQSCFMGAYKYEELYNNEKQK